MKTLPLFPLSSAVMPGGILPLRIFETRYLDMVLGCLRENTGFGICLVAEGRSPFPYGTLIEIVDWDRDDSGLLTITTLGVQKFRTISTSVKESGLIIGEVELLPAEPKTQVPVEYTDLADLLHRALENVAPLLDYTEADFTDAVWVSGRLVELLPMPIEERHELIAVDNPIDRLKSLNDIVHELH